MRAALLDALGTLVELERPWPHLVAELGARGVAVSEDDARRAMLAEMAYYRDHHDDAVDEPHLEDLRRRCAGIVRAELGIALAVEEVEAAMLAAIRFRAYPEVPVVLRELRARGAAVVVVSNWDVSLHDVLARTGLRELVDHVVTSAEFGAAKPDPAIFHHALELAGAPAAEAVHAGDSVEADVAGARRAGIPVVLVARDGEVAPPGVRAVPTLEGLLGEAPPPRPPRTL
jgi:putative hydrolase of the HAD superfamily